VKLAAALIALTLVGTAYAAPSEDELIGVITMQPRAAKAPEYARALLDKLTRQQRLAEHTAWVDRMLVMPRLLAGREDLILALQDMQIGQRFLDARIFMAHAGRSHLTEDWRRAANAFIDAAEVSQRWSTSVDVRDGYRVISMADEMMFDAGKCWEEAGDVTAALASYSEVVRLPLAPLATQRMLALGLRAVLLVHAEGAAWLAR
jgi:hypothetical protein